MATGFNLRGRVDAFADVLTDVEAFLEEQGVLGAGERTLIANLEDGIEDLFYLIPLEGQEQEDK